MNKPDSPALRTALAYYHAWTSHDLDKAMSYIADDIVCDAPAGRLEGAVAYRGFMGPFVRILTGSTLIAAFAVLEMGNSAKSWFRPSGRYPDTFVASEYGEFALRVVGA